LDRSRARDWLSGLDGLRKRYFHGALDEGVPPVSIAVLDTGIDNTNPDIMETWGKKAQLTERYRDFLEDSGSVEELGVEPYTKEKVAEAVRQTRLRGRDLPQDDTGHGTHVAGIVMQLCPEATLFIGRVLPKNVLAEEEETRAAAKRLALVCTCTSLVKFWLRMWMVLTKLRLSCMQLMSGK
jgi:hypothetical protein